MHWILKVCPKINVELFTFLFSVDNILYQSTFPFFILSSLVFNFNKVVLKYAKNLLKFNHVSLVNGSKDVIENFLKRF